MSDVIRCNYGTELCSVQENRKLIVDGCDPETIHDELRAANFTREGSRYVKKRPRLRAEAGDNGAGALHVLSARVVEESLHVQPSDVVGVVKLVPGMSVQVEPKITWEHVIRMLLTVYDIDRTQSYYGIPLEELISGEIEASQLIAILAINYVYGVKTISKKGFIRDLNIRRRDGFEGLGSVDVSQTLMNHATGNPEPTWVETEIDYANPVNEAIHMAGKLLLRLLQQERDGHQHPRQDLLLSMVHQQVKEIENRGIQSSQKRLGEYRRLSLADLPRQRHYYRRAVHTSQSILSSALLGQTGGSPEELLVDYALSMNSLFQDYTQRVLGREVEKVRKLDHLDQLSDVECQYEPRIHPFEGNAEAAHEPDHLLTDGENTLAVLDSKYYRKGKNPANDSASRSRMFAYAYLTESDRMAFLCPQYHRDRLPVTNTGGEVEILSPDDEFTCDEYERLTREYLLESLAIEYPALNVFDAVAEGKLCLEGVSEDNLSEIYDPKGPFAISNPATFAARVINDIAFSTYGPNKPDLENQGQWTKNRIKDACGKTDEEDRPLYPQHETTCVPVYTSNAKADHGQVTLYFLQRGEEGVSVAKEGPWALM
ncbi:5-methylcytosine restriction system specificity protein McrC [Halobellus sp. EA9]|uniref:5-methylcytosine restriction system specificity protein McrC n=1 Tax=Halobellus sp. EA9 TaxID=3421647 RepID=UPI003EC0AC47